MLQAHVCVLGSKRIRRTFKIIRTCKMGNYNPEASCTIIDQYKTAVHIKPPPLQIIFAKIWMSSQLDISPWNKVQLAVSGSLSGVLALVLVGLYSKWNCIDMSQRCKPPRLSIPISLLNELKRHPNCFMLLYPNLSSRLPQGHGLPVCRN